ncbi:FAD-binding oxidoreductase [Actinomadura sp. NAK00032]|uniref:FAD-binding oxidoreductase n=1 Tax=Actinomadura sp. NAK00032 TaxID=2742128 RepID=UPI00159184A6|nr:FAD-binding oxidoreductase [Actinomadura sp. NAK00032]QKW37572.1 FAD-binding oxidoreductase [Actinomadura sp. NAK00032]
MSRPHDIAGIAARLRDTIGGAVHRAGDDGYDDARLPWRRLTEVSPALVAEATGAGDVRDILLAAREGGLPLVVQATGHGTIRSYEGGLMLRTGAMTGVEVDPERRTARVGAGATWGDVLAAAAPHGLMPLSGTALSVGVVGYTLGGGASLLSRRHGFAADSVVRAEVVTAEGKVLAADAEENPDLFWALRGGGGNFGIVTSMEFRLYPLTHVYGGMAMFDIGRAEQAIARYREWAPGQPDDLSTALVLLKMPDSPQLPEPMRGMRALGLRVVHAGDADEAERLLAPLRAAAGEPIMYPLRTMPCADMTTEIFGPPPPPMLVESSIDLARDLPGELAGVCVDAVMADGPVAAVELRYWGGAMARPEPGAGPVGHRDVPFSIITGSAPAAGREQITEARSAIDTLVSALRPHLTGGAFLNFLEDPDVTATAYTAADHRRLTEVKRAYDPDNVFAGNHNIPPAR